MHSDKFKTIKGLIFLFIPLLYVSLGTMINVYTSSIPFIDWARLLVSFVGVFVICKSLNLVQRQKSIFLIRLLWLMVLILGATFLKHVYAFRPESIREIADSIMWICVLFWAYKVSYKSNDIFAYAPYLAWVIPIFTLAFMNIRMFLLGDDNLAMISTAYYPMMFLPLVLLNKKLVIKWGLIILILITILLSSKRGAFITLFIGLAVYYYVCVSNQKSFSKIIIFLIGGAIMCFAMINFMDYFIAENDLTIFDRLANIEEDGGSGRDEVWKHTWGMIVHSGPLSLLFGHGFNSVYSDSVLELSAHNDFLEIIYDYGFVGLVIYISIYVKLFKYYKKMKIYMPEIAGPFAASIAMALSISMVAHLVINPMQFMFLTMFWGFCIAKCDKCILKKYTLNGKSS